MGIYSLLDEFGFTDAARIGSMEQMRNVELTVRGARVVLCAYIVQPHGRSPIYFRCRQNHAPAIFIETGEATLVISETGGMLFAFGEHPGIRDALAAAGFERHIDDFDR